MVQASVWLTELLQTGFLVFPSTASPAASPATMTLQVAVLAVAVQARAAIPMGESLEVVWAPCAVALSPEMILQMAHSSNPHRRWFAKSPAGVLLVQGLLPAGSLVQPVWPPDLRWCLL